MNPINAICYDIKRSDVQNILYAAENNKMVNMLGAFDDLDLFVEYLNQNNHIGIIIVGLLTSEGTSLHFIKLILKVYPSAILIAYTCIESQFIIDTLLQEGVTNVFHKSVNQDVVLCKAIEAYLKNVNN